MLPLHLIIVAANEQESAQFERPDNENNYVLTRIINPQKRALAHIGNHYLNAVSAGVVGLCHADTSFGPDALNTFAKVAQAGSVCGIVGIDFDRTYRWGKDNPGPVSTLDSCSIFLRGDLGLRFDEKTFDGMHCHVEDLCLQAQSQGIPVVVPAAKADHVGRRTLLPEWQAEYAMYRTRLAAKWLGTKFQTT